MKVKMLTMYSGPRGNFSPGKIVEFSEAEGAALVAGHFAEAIQPKAQKQEAAVIQPQEKATTYKRGRK